MLSARTCPRPLAALALFSVALIGGSGSLAAQSRTVNFDFYVSGIRAGELTLESERSGGSYTASSRIDTAGIVGIFADFFFDGEAQGRIAADGRLVPERFEGDSRSPRADRKTKIDWKDGTPVSVSVEPPRKLQPDPATQAGTLDPVSAGLALLGDAPVEDVCDKTVDIFDGSRRTRIRLEAAVAGERGLECGGIFSRLEGEEHSFAVRREFPFTVVFRANGSGVAELERIESRTSFGRAVIERRG